MWNPFKVNKKTPELYDRGRPDVFTICKTNVFSSTVIKMVH